MNEGDFVRMVEEAKKPLLTEEEQRIEAMAGMLKNMLDEWHPRSAKGSKAKLDAHCGVLALQVYLLVNNLGPEGLKQVDPVEVAKLRDR